MPNESLQHEVDQNYEAFKKMLPELLEDRRGKYALLRNEELIDVFDSAGDALKYAEATYSDGRFSIQKITADVVDLGYYSRAVSYAAV